jgi:hypothetical protein
MFELSFLLLRKMITLDRSFLTVPILPNSKKDNSAFSVKKTTYDSFDFFSFCWSFVFVTHERILETFVLNAKILALLDDLSLEEILPATHWLVFLLFEG